MPATDFAVGLARTLREVVRPLESALESPDALRVLLLEHGWHLAEDDENAAAVLAERLGFDARIGALVAALDEVVGIEGIGSGEATAALDAAIELLSALRDADSTPTAGPAPLDRPAFWQTFPGELAQTLLASYLERRRAALFAPLLLAGVIDHVRVPADATIGRVAYTRTDLRWDRLGTAITDPAALVREVYGWGSALEHEKLTERLHLACYAFGIPTTRRLAHHALVDEFYAADNPVLERLREVRAPLVVDREIDGDYIELGVALLPIPAAGEPDGAPNGLLLGLYAEGEFGADIPVGGPFLLQLAGGLAADAAVGIELRPGAVKARLREAGPAVDASATLIGRPFAPWIPIGRDDGHRVALHDLALGVEVRGEASDPELRLRLATTKLDVVVDMEDGDGFLHSLLGSEPQTSTVAGALIWSSKNGLTFEGSAGLALALPVDKSLGGVRITALTIAIGTSDDTTSVSASITAVAHLGPVVAAIEGIGIELRIDPRADTEPPGNFGAVDLAFGFRPPTGIGLAIDAGPVRGGGYLFADHDRGEYAGALELMLGRVGVKAIGVLAQRPDGWSLLLVLYGQFAPIQLSFGFTLTGIGGLVGVGHGIDVPALIAGLKTGAFDDILFPDDPVANAPRIIGRLRTIFPSRPGALTIGPMVELEWGRPRPIAFVRLAILLQLDNAIGSGSVAFSRVVLIGSVRIALGPSEDDPDAAIVRLIVDFLGFWEADRECYGFLARLRDSRLGPVDVVGALGVWGEYGDHPRFLLAAGGFNPRFNDLPAEMSGVLDRLGAAFKVGRFDFTLKGYFAMTPGTIQAGVDLAAKGKLGPVGIKGTIGFDALVYREPYTHFIVDFRVSAEVTYKGRTLAGVKVSGTLEGPGRWHLVGKVSFSILWWDISKSFDESWGDATEIATAATDVAALIAAELAKPANWSASLPAGSEALVTLAPPPGDLATLAHPLGRFVFTQTIAPLGLQLERYGSGPVAGPSRFDIEAVTVGGQLLATPPRITEHFARAEFVELSEEERLTKPSFEELDAGVEFARGDYRVPAGLTADLDYERTAYLDLDPRRPGGTRPAHGLGRVAVDSAFIGMLAANGAAGRAPQRRDEFMRAQTDARIELSPPPLAAVDRDRFELEPEGALAGRARFATMLAEQALAPGGQLVEESEL